MTRRSPTLAALPAFALFAAPVAAQDSAPDQDAGSRIPDAISLPAPTPAPSPAPSGGLVAIPPSGGGAQGDAIGPGSLRDFSLGGTPAPRRATPTPAPAPAPAPAPRRALPTPVPPPEASQGQAATRTPTITPVRGQGSIGTITPVAPREAPSAEPLAIPDTLGSDLPFDNAPGGMTAPQSGVANWPWLLALLALLGGAAFAFALRRQRQVAPAAPAPLLEPLPEQPATPVPAPPEPAPPPPQPLLRQPAGDKVPAGTIGTRLAPDLAIEVEPLRAVLAEDGFTLDYRLVITNRGLGEARMPTVRQDFLFASPSQADDFDQFLSRPIDRRDRPLPRSIPPQSEIRLDARAHLPSDRTQLVEVGGRRLLLPILALGVRHAGQPPVAKPAASGAWLIGRPGGSDGKMAPIRADQGPRVIRNVEMRRQ